MSKNFQAHSTNEFYMGCLLEEFSRQGVTEVFIAPGSRSTPLVLAAEKNKKLNKHIHTDERALGFMALGSALETENVPIIITTSGTAVANLYPAVVEAHHAGVALIIITADRPFELRDTGANQSINQLNFFGSYVKNFYDLPCPEISVPLESYLTTASQAYFECLNQDPSPVHINCQLREPLFNGEDEYTEPNLSRQLKDWRDSSAPYSRNLICESKSLDLPKSISEKFRSSHKGLIVLGKSTSLKSYDNLSDLSQSLNCPILADIQSSVRHCGIPSLVNFHDLILHSESLEQLDPEVVLYIGKPVISKKLNEFLCNTKAEIFHFSETEKRINPSSLPMSVIKGDSDELIKGLLKQVKAPEISARNSAWMNTWKDLDNRASSVLSDKFESPTAFSEPWISHIISKLIPPKTNLYLGSSRPIRDMDRFCFSEDKNLKIFSNRGASGIDGNIATIAGINKNSSAATTALLGDLTVFHDLSSLKLVTETIHPLVIVAINNNGGGIFSFLPVRDSTHHEKYFGTPHDLHFKHFCNGFGIEYVCPETPAQFTSTYLNSIEQSQTTFIEINTSRLNVLEDHMEIIDCVRSECNE